jgi:hypothetical protein
MNHFPNMSRSRNRRPVVNVTELPDNPSFAKRFWKGVLICVGFAFLAVFLLLLLSALKFAGVK